MQVSLIGMGLMGTAMAERLMTLGHDVVVYNRTEEKCTALQQRGALRARSAAEAIEASKCTILMLADAPAIQEVLFSSRKPNVQNRTIIQMGTIAPSESIALGREIRTGIGDYFEAPVLGSLAEAKAGRLLVMVGGKADHVERWDEVLKCFCEAPLLVGPIGQAAALKLALNQLIAAHITAFSLSLGLIQRAGVEVETFMNVLRQSALMAPMFEKKMPRLLARDYARAQLFYQASFKGRRVMSERGARREPGNTGTRRHSRDPGRDRRARPARRRYIHRSSKSWSRKNSSAPKTYSPRPGGKRRNLGRGPGQDGRSRVNVHVATLLWNGMENIPYPVNLHHGHDQPLFHAVVRKGIDDGFPGKQCAGKEDSDFPPVLLWHCGLGASAVRSLKVRRSFHGAASGV